MDAMSITDHGSLYGVVDFYSECKDAGIKPIIGCEFYVAHGSRHDRTPNERTANHLVLIARDNAGYRNLLQLVTRSHLEGFHYRPRIDKELLDQCRQGLICLSGCPSAEVPTLLADGNYDAAQASGGLVSGAVRRKLLPGVAAPRAHRAVAPHQRRLDSAAPGNGYSPAGHQRRPLRPPVRLPVSGRVHLHPDRHQRPGRQTAADGGFVLLHQVAGGNGRPVPGFSAGPGHHRRGCPAVRRVVGFWTDAPAALSDPQRRGCRLIPGAYLLGRIQQALRPQQRRCPRPDGVRAGSGKANQFRQLLPGGLGHHLFRPPAADTFRRAGQRRRQRRALLPGHHRHRPLGLQPGVRALPEL